MLSSEELRKEFLDFFSQKGHRIVPSSSLIPYDDPSVLFTTAGMQQFKPYYSSKLDPLKDKHFSLSEPLGTRNVASCQKCFRTTDIDSVGDASHLTFFEMLGNFSFGGYFKKEAIKYAWEFISTILHIPKERIYVTVFQGDDEIPFDDVSYKAWLQLGLSPKKILRGNRKDNFWGPTGQEGPCGPTTEIYVDGIEIWNLVFNEYYQSPDKKLTPLQIKGVDTGMGLERLTLVMEFPKDKEKTIFDTDLFRNALEILRKHSSNKVPSEKNLRIIADHLRATIFLISEGVRPSNTDRGYIARRLIRRIARCIKAESLSGEWMAEVIDFFINKYKKAYPSLKSQEQIERIIQEEIDKFQKSLEKGLKIWQKLLRELKNNQQKIVPGDKAFFLYETYGFPLEFIKELAREENLQIDEVGFRKLYQQHQQISRAGASQKFGGHGVNTIEDEEKRRKIIKLHTATHLLLQALRQILGDSIEQRGSDINAERLRLDFPFARKLSREELQKVEDLVNRKIQEGLSVIHYEMPLNEALKSGAIATFTERYPDVVTVYEIKNSRTGEVFSKEICAGPHVQNTKEIGVFKILKEESVGRGLRRIRATIEDDL